MTDYILAFQAVIWLLILWLFVQSRSASIFHPFSFYLAFHGMVFVLWPILGRTFGFERTFFYMRFYPTDDQIQGALVATMVALVVFAATSWAFDTVTPRFKRVVLDGFSSRQWQAFVVTAGVLAPVALYSALLSIRDAVGVEGREDALQMERDVDTGVMAYTNTTGYLADAQKMLGTLCLMLIWGARFRLWSFFPLLVYIAQRAYLGWGRWTIVLALASLVLLYVTRTGRRWVPARFIILAIPAFILFQQLGQNRDVLKTFLSGQSAKEDVIDSGETWIDRQDSLDFANLDYLTYVMNVVPEKSGTYTYFTQYLQLFTEPIPRQLWPAKPFGPPIQLVNLNDYGNFLGLTNSLVGDGWLSGGWLGVALTLGLVGYILARLHRWFWRGEASTFKVLAYCSFLPLTAQWFRDGGISIAKFMLFTIFPLLVWQAAGALLGGQRAQAGARRALGRTPSHGDPSVLPPAE